MIRALTMTALVVLTMTASGCLITSKNSSYEHGVKVGPHMRSQISPGETTQEWVLATLGEPTSRRLVEEEPRVEVFGYEYSKTNTSRGSVFLIFGGSTNRTTSSKTYVELTDGVVSRYWTE